MTEKKGWFSFLPFPCPSSRQHMELFTCHIQRLLYPSHQDFLHQNISNALTFSFQNKVSRSHILTQDFCFTSQNDEPIFVLVLTCHTSLAFSLLPLSRPQDAASPRSSSHQVFNIFDHKVQHFALVNCVHFISLIYQHIFEFYHYDLKCSQTFPAASHCR